MNTVASGSWPQPEQPVDTGWKVREKDGLVQILVEPEGIDAFHLNLDPEEAAQFGAQVSHLAHQLKSRPVIAALIEQKNSEYICPQCGPDPRGSEIHAREFHTIAGLMGEAQP